jgi:hypothetical protein
LKTGDMSKTFETFKERIMDSVNFVGSDKEGNDELWNTFSKDMTDVCCLLKNSLRVTFVDNITCMDIDKMAVNLFVTTERILWDWTEDFYRDDFEVDDERVWMAYKSLLLAMSLFCDTKKCESALLWQYNVNVKPKPNKKVCKSMRKRPRGVSKRLGKEADSKFR